MKKGKNSICKFNARYSQTKINFQNQSSDLGKIGNLEFLIEMCSCSRLYANFENIVLPEIEKIAPQKSLWIESVQDFLIKLDMKPCMHLVEISIFSLKSFLCAKFGWIFQKKFSMRNIWLIDQLLLKDFFENFYN